MAIQYGFGASVSEGLIFAYDTLDTVNSYLGEPTTNHIYHQNARLDGSYESYMPEAGTGNITNNHPGAIRVFNTAGGDISYYLNTGINTANSGVEWYNTRHAYWVFDTILERPVVRMYNETGVWQAKYFGTGLASLNSIGIINGTSYTVSWLQYVENLDRAAHVGIYSYSTTRGYNDFHDGLQNGYNTEVNTWQRVSITFIAKDYGQLGSGPSMYFYGMAVGSGELRIADVQLEVKPHATQYSSAYNRSATQSLLPLAGNLTLNISNVSFDSNAQIVFDGTDDTIPIGTVGGYSSNITCESVFRTTSGASWKNIISGGCGDILFTVNGNLLNFGAQCSSPILHANYSNTVVNTGAWFHAVATYNGSLVKIYINGVLENTYARSGSFTPGALRVGSASSGASEFFQGDLPLLKVYNRALTASEVTQNFKKYQTRFALA